MTWSVAGTVAQGLTRLGFSVLVGRVAGPHTLGDVGLLVSLATFLALCGPQAIASTAARLVAATRGVDDDVVAHLAVRVALTTAVVLGLLAAGVSLLLGNGRLLSLECGGLVVAYSSYLVVRGIRIGRGQFATAALWDALGSTVALSLVMLALLTERSELLLVPLIVGYLVAGLRGWPHPGDTASAEVRRSLVRHAAWGTVFVLSWAGLLQLTMVIAGSRAEAAEVGLYTAALALATPGALLAVAVRTAFVPELAELHAAGHERQLSKRVDRLMRGTVLIALPPFAVAGLLASPLLRLVFGADFQSADRYLVPLLFGTALSAVTAHQAWLLNGPAWGVRVLAVSALAALCLGVVITVAGAESYGMAAASTGFLAGSVLFTLVPYVVVWVRSGQRWGWLTVRAAAGYTAWLAMIQVADGDPARVVASASFVLGWLVLNLGDLRMLRQSSARPRARGARPPAAGHAP
ncbi:hypothetical protein GCM10027448_43050 [Nocardioides dilutus]